MPPTGSQDIDYLREHGPSPSSELSDEGLSVTEKKRGAASFNITTSAATCQGGRASTIAYIIGEHDQEEVIRAWIEANPHILDNRGRGQLRADIRGYGRSWGEAADEVLDDYFG